MIVADFRLFRNIYPFRYSAGVIPVSRLNNLEKNEGLGKFSDSAICQTGRSLYFSCSLACWMMWRYTDHLALPYLSVPISKVVV